MVEELRKVKEAYLYQKKEGNKVHCHLCNHHCLITDGDRGLCNVRENRSGVLLSLVYGKVIAGHVDPIEKKPLFHFLPGSLSYSIATAGCNFKCAFCQNADISQMPVDHNKIAGRDSSPNEIVKDAVENHALSISYTYTEPTIYFETALDTARLAVAEGLKNVFVSNGYMTKECLQEIDPHLHAANVDLKAFDDRFYRDLCGGKLAPVLRTIETMKEMGIWLEVTTLLIPGLNDSEEELKKLARFLAELDSGIPWHISRFHPTYKLNHIHSTDVESIRRARDIGFEAGLEYVYTGNVPGENGENTFCGSCREPIIERIGFRVVGNRLEDGKCPSCGIDIPGVWTS
jgi:pyruvate formate lyase activating enzyme